MAEDEEQYLVRAVLPSLRRRGWQGTLSEYYELCAELGGQDPLALDPPITCKRRDSPEVV